MIKKYNDGRWDLSWHNISKHPNVTMENIVNNPTEPFFWNWLYISINPNLTIEMIENNPNESWSWYKILNHSFKKEYENELKKLQNFKKIEEELIQKTWHPSRFQEWCVDNEDQKKDNEE